MTSANSSSEQDTPTPIATDDSDDAGVASAFAQALLQADEQSAPLETDTTAPSASEQDATKKPESLDDLAKALGVEPSDLYAVKIPRSNGEPLTLGALKDRFDEWAGLDAERIQWNESRTQQDNALAMARQELDELLAALPRESLSQESIKQAASKVQQRIQRERARTLDAIPEWREEARRTEELQGIAGLMEQYGLPPTYLGTVQDHRLMRLLRDSWRREQQVQKALATVKRVKDKTPAAAKNSAPAPKKGPAASPNNRSGGMRNEVINSLRAKAGI